MSAEDRDEILAELRVIRRLIKGVGGCVGAGLVALTLVGISDHYDQRNLREDSNWMKPKVEALWWRSNLPEPSDAALETERPERTI